VSPAAAPAADPDTAAAGARLREELAAVLEAQRAALIAGVPGAGAAAAAALSDVYDRDLARRWQRACEDISAPLALCATGGWGRRELAPASDLDFIVLHRGDEAQARLVADRLLYPLWDARVAVGHAVREPRAAARLARGDLATATALLDIRHLVGDAELTDELARCARGAIAPGGDANEVIGQLAADKKRRHDRFGDSLYLLEPNLKQGIGALRDLATALWAARARWLLRGAPLPGHGETIELLARDGHLSRRQADVLLRARDFLLGLRVLLQLASKRKGDQLTFELQETIAPTLALADAGPALAQVQAATDGALAADVRPAVAPAVEALMRTYYLHARGVVQVGERLLETARVPTRKKPRIHRVDGSFLTFNGELAVHDARVLADRPSEMLRLFRVAVDQGIAVYGHTRDVVAELAPQHAEELRADPAAARLFVEALVDLRDKGQPSALELLHQLGVVSAMLPEWAPCTCRVQHDLYHVYTVDQHQLLAVAMLKRIGRGELAAEYPVATDAFARVHRLAPLVLATLLHDVGKPLGKGHAEKGAVLAAAIGRRLGFDDNDVAVTEMLVRQHLTMAHISQRRDLTDPDVIARFAEKIGDEERLAQLYLLTLCDTAMTAPDNMSAWKDELMRTLYLRAREHLVAAASSPGMRLAPDVDERRGKILALLAGDANASPPTGSYPPIVVPPRAITEPGAGPTPMSSPAVTALVHAIDERFLTQLSPRQAARHVRLVMATRARASHVGVAVTHLPLKGHSEVAVVAPDAHGVLAAIAGALVAHRVYVLGAVAGHAEPVDGQPAAALDLFFVRDGVGAAIAADDPRWARLEADLAALIGDGPPEPAAIAALIARRRPPSGLPPRITPAIATEIRLDNAESTDATIVEVFTRDRAGVLHAITRTLADAALDISLSKISTEGEKVADVFYVTRDGAKLTDPAVQDALRERLARALAELPG
jgi:[protein-PII] uridylyltransferase